MFKHPSDQGSSLDQVFPGSWLLAQEIGKAHRNSKAPRSFIKETTQDALRERNGPLETEHQGVPGYWWGLSFLHLRRGIGTKGQGMSGFSGFDEQTWFILLNLFCCIHPSHDVFGFNQSYINMDAKYRVFPQSSLRRYNLPDLLPTLLKLVHSGSTLCLSFPDMFPGMSDC